MGRWMGGRMCVWGGLRIDLCNAPGNRSNRGWTERDFAVCVQLKRKVEWHPPALDRDGDDLLAVDLEFQCFGERLCVVGCEDDWNVCNFPWLENHAV
jgi:hypothetical protein